MTYYDVEQVKATGASNKINDEALRLLINFARLRRVNGASRIVVVWAPPRGRWPARFAAMTVAEMDRLKYMDAEPWRLVGVYRHDVPQRYLADDLAAWTAETAAALT